MGAALAKESAPLCWFEVVDVSPSEMSCSQRPCLFLGMVARVRVRKAQGEGTKSGGGLQKKEKRIEKENIKKRSSVTRTIFFY